MSSLVKLLLHCHTGDQDCSSWTYANYVPAMISLVVHVFVLICSSHTLPTVLVWFLFLGQHPEIEVKFQLEGLESQSLRLDTSSVWIANEAITASDISVETPWKRRDDQIRMLHSGRNPKKALMPPKILGAFITAKIKLLTHETPQSTFKT